ncbi:MAG: 2OG-Fe(II) oxygenase [Rhizomicrobium sp.]
MNTPATLEQRAAAGDPDSQIALARELEAQEKYVPARGWYARAAQSGNAAALTGLAASLMSHEPFEIQNGMRFMRTAAEQGDADALHVCAALAAQDDVLPGNWDVALDFLTTSAASGSRLAQDELRLLAGQTGDDWLDLRGAIEVPRWLASPVGKDISESPRIRTIANFAPPEVCDWLVARAQGRAKRARVYDPVTGGATVEEHRTNSAANFDIVDWDLPLVFLRHRIAREVSLPTHCLEHPMVLHYLVGQAFEPHYDFLDPAMPGPAREIAEKGQRVATFLLYLNEDYEGAETEFLELGIHHRGRKGDALLFWNLDANGAPDFRTRHAGRTPSQGEKWILSQWIRQPKGQ